MTQKKVLVTGATGQQGGQVARSLVQDGHSVTALVRDLNSEKSAGLQSLGIQLAKGEFGDHSSLVKAMAGQDSAFAVGTSFVAGVEVETTQGKALVDAAAEAGISHLVYSSVGGADRATGVPHFDSKFEVEKHVAASGLNWTITAPSYFMENALFPWNVADMQRGVFRQPMSPNTKLQQIPISDIGRLNAAVISEGGRHYGRRIEIASDELTGAELASVLSNVTGRDIVYEVQPLEEAAAMSADVASMYEWFESAGYSADIDGLRSEFPEVGWTTFKDWSGSIEWSTLLAA